MFLLNSTSFVTFSFFIEASHIQNSASGILSMFVMFLLKVHVTGKKFDFLIGITTT